MVPLNRALPYLHVGSLEITRTLKHIKQRKSHMPYRWSL